MSTVFKGWGGAWGDSWGPVVVDPNAMYGSAALRFTAAATITGAGAEPGDMVGAAVFALSASAVLSVAARPRPGASSGYGRRGHHGRRWTPPTPRRSRHDRERESILAIFGR